MTVRLLCLILSATICASCASGADARPGWPLTPLARPAVPAARAQTTIGNPIDAFVLARLDRAGLRPAGPADRRALIRRVAFDLTGLLPTPAEVDAFLADQSPNAYEKVVDRLLASSRFGERWAQHWLDVVRYADTDGYKLDRIRPYAWRYRDYVIRSFNEDRPYDRFVQEQLAGDELEQGGPDARVATGFYRLPAEETNASDYRAMRQDLLDDITEVVGLTFLGLTVGCARCHDHKFDPVSQRDYYRLQAFFAPLIQRETLLGSAQEVDRYTRMMSRWEEATHEVRREIDVLMEPARKAILEELLVTFDAETQAALRALPERRNPLQQQLATLAGKQIAQRFARAYRRLAAEPRARYDALQKRLASFDSLKPPPLPLASVVADTGPLAPPTHRLAAGNLNRPREEVHPAFLACLDPTPPAILSPSAAPASTGRRSTLARWLCRPDHPLTARVVVNRLWQHYTGRGIVGTPNDFGVMGDKATHPELLDWLASELVQRRWPLKAIHRLIVTSATYRQSSDPEENPTAAAAMKVDPEDRLLWHMRSRRREAEGIRDAALQVAGELSPRLYGPPAQPELPEAVKESRYAWDADQSPAERNRRSIYVLARRNLAYPLFAAFDVPDRHSSCPARPATITAPQALAMLNGEFTLARARRMADRLLTGRGADRRGLVRDAYRLVFSREPDAQEWTAAERFLDRDVKLIAGGPGPRSEPPLTAAVVDLCHALLSSAELLYVD